MMDFQHYWEEMQRESGEMRKKRILYLLDVKKPGIEISPLYSPITEKNKHNVFYTDYTSADESRKKHADYEHPEIVDLDFIWEQDKNLKDCLNSNNSYEWAIASHVLEHVPNPIGWMNQILEVINVGGYLSLALPNKSLTNDILRDETKFHQWYDAWINQYKIPSAGQLYDFIRNSASQGVTSNGDSNKRHYSAQDAINLSQHSWINNEYLDAHCSVFTPQSFSILVNEAVLIGLMNVEIDDITPGGQEFYVRIKKIGDPAILPPAKATKNSDHNAISNEKELRHYKKAYDEAIQAQEILKSEIDRVRKRNIWHRILNR
ncbi:class I SAM-dependent methyltransferase [Dickeya dadantii]|uniref:class I SAM-dependent methyltransferase n=1 Tax=Dickeya dadantii TaxID=204038 RepID=UPI0021D85774|nr:class I SAM-dependent methyltransferase [Dickeya dadantii]